MRTQTLLLSAAAAGAVIYAAAASAKPSGTASGDTNYILPGGEAASTPIDEPIDEDGEGGAETMPPQIPDLPPLPEPPKPGGAEKAVAAVGAGSALVGLLESGATVVKDAAAALGLGSSAGTSSGVVGWTGGTTPLQAFPASGVGAAASGGGAALSTALPTIGGGAPVGAAGGTLFSATQSAWAGPVAVAAIAAKVFFGGRSRDEKRGKNATFFVRKHFKDEESAAAFEKTAREKHGATDTQIKNLADKITAKDWLGVHYARQAITGKRFYQVLSDKALREFRNGDHGGGNR